MTVEITFEDRKAYTRPWTLTFDATFVADTELLENVCNENEKSLQHFVITEEELTAAPAGGGGFVVVPESDTRFSASGAVVIFNVDAKGVVTDFVVRIVEGDQKYERKQ